MLEKFSLAEKVIIVTGGTGILGDEFVNAINTKFKATMPSIYCPTCQGVKFP